MTISHSSSETTKASPLDDDSDDDSDADVEGGTGKEEEEEEALCCTPVTRTPSTMRTGKDMLGTRAKSTRDEEDTIILDTHTPPEVATLMRDGDFVQMEEFFFVGENTALYYRPKFWKNCTSSSSSSIVIMHRLLPSPPKATTTTTTTTSLASSPSPNPPRRPL